MLGETGIGFEKWQYEPVFGGFGGGINEAHRLYRVRGTAYTQGGLRPWSMILKVLSATDGSGEPGAWDFWKREALLYQSGLLDDLADGLVDGLTAPQCYGVAEPAEDQAWIWMEDVREAGDTDAAGRWRLAQFGRAAERLGLYNGAYLAGRQPLRQPTQQPWLNRGDWRARLQGGEALFADLPAYRRHPLAQRMIPDAMVPQFVGLWERRSQLADELREGPRCFCHNDAFRRNLVLRRTSSGMEFVAIDWAFAGESAVGEEIAKMVITSLVYLERPAADMRALYETVYNGYLAGLRAAGWTGEASRVRRNYRAAALLVFLEHIWLGLRGINSDFPIEVVEHIYGHSIDAIMAQGAALTQFVMALAEERGAYS